MFTFPVPTYVFIARVYVAAAAPRGTPHTAPRSTPTPPAHVAVGGDDTVVGGGVVVVCGDDTVVDGDNTVVDDDVVVCGDDVVMGEAGR